MAGYSHKMLGQNAIIRDSLFILGNPVVMDGKDG